MKLKIFCVAIVLLLLSGCLKHVDSFVLRAHVTQCSFNQITLVTPDLKAIQVSWGPDWHHPYCYEWNQSTWWDITMAGQPERGQPQDQYIFITMEPVHPVNAPSVNAETGRR